MLSRLAARSIRLAHTSSSASQAAASATPATTNEERNEVDFPRTKRPIHPAPVRMGFIPETWFELLYSKTGVTGPYVLGTGLITYLVSKEIYVIEHEFYSGVIMAMMAAYGIKKFGPTVAATLDDQLAKEKEEMLSGRNNTIKALTEGIAASELSAEQAKGQSLLFQAKRDNIGLQLEAAYRQRLQSVYAEVKKRLDYQLEKSNVEKRFEQRHMVDWIVQNVRQSITPAQEAASLKQCITDLKALAARA
ncbi:ATP synthase subunit b, mitochondrial isoform X2 [Hyalella azteca]|uniref:ATP synthase subunit b n=1 Tax=Hyalella azteca TaxID=294128 RepID=A0A8B7N085_HYAAZ|nr:ATP synthase subunit b, mitochondrial isoform X2 [Hyalella azteca]